MFFLNFKKLRKNYFLALLTHPTITVLFFIYIFNFVTSDYAHLNKKSNNLPSLKNDQEYNKQNIQPCNSCVNCSVCIHENAEPQDILPLVAVPSRRKYFYEQDRSKDDDLNDFPVEDKINENDERTEYDNDYSQNELSKKKKKMYNFIENHNEMPDMDNDVTDEEYEENMEEENTTNLESNYENTFNSEKEDSTDSKVILPLQQLKDSQYVGFIQIGNPPQTIRPIFDTGSTNIWIVSTKCKDKTCLKVHRYNHKLSDTFKYYTPRTNLDIMFGTGIIQGTIGIETFKIGPFKIENQSFGLVKREKGTDDKSNVFERINFEGIVGLAFPAMLSTGGNPIYENLMSSYNFPHNEFSIYIGMDNKYSALIFGGVEKKFFEGDIYMFPVVREYYWEIKFDGLYIDHQKFCCDSGSIVYDLKMKDENKHKKKYSMRKYFHKHHFNHKKIWLRKNHHTKRWKREKHFKPLNPDENYLIFDSGTSFNSVPKSEIKYFFKVVPPKECNDDNIDEVIDSYPNLTYVINNMPFTLTPSQYLIRKRNMCKPAFMEIEVSPEYGHAYILGNAAFMKHYYTVYRRGKGNNDSYVGIAKAVHTKENAEYLNSLHKERMEDEE
ncbi:plasmepsin IX, putative [Plasmodium chabaudi chabaudi]|uniref:Plasmepsin IX, putative n=1 Tax=Plasmodium chabaudi chabaudi TaxID=31271 RepID=A0A1D3LEN7_PLACU|nr:plasmepsin IX, putative [Plasmodium chabaudi chabaudi]